MFLCNNRITEASVHTTIGWHEVFHDGFTSGAAESLSRSGPPRDWYTSTPRALRRRNRMNRIGHGAVIRERVHGTDDELSNNRTGNLRRRRLAIDSPVAANSSRYKL